MEKLLEEKLLNLNLFNEKDFEDPQIKKSFRNVYIKELFLFECIKEKKYNLIEYAFKKNMINNNLMKSIINKFEFNNIEDYLRLFEINNNLVLTPLMCQIESIEKVLKNDKISSKRKDQYIEQLGRNYYGNHNIDILKKIFEIYPNSHKVSKIMINYIYNELSAKNILKMSINDIIDLLNKMHKNVRTKMAIQIANMYIDKNGVVKYIKMSKESENKIFNSQVVLNNLKSIYLEQINYNKILENF